MLTDERRTSQAAPPADREAEFAARVADVLWRSNEPWWGGHAPIEPRSANGSMPHLPGHRVDLS